jgi:exopolyphosphatase/guanosine-5'-triphosphate,3'-diphosphate pyrophosphatase
VFGGIDLGTNNCRMLVGTPAAHGFHVLDSFSRVVRLGEGLYETGRLSPIAMERAIASLSICAERAKRWAGDSGTAALRLRAIATEGGVRYPRARGYWATSGNHSPARGG